MTSLKNFFKHITFVQWGGLVICLFLFSFTLWSSFAPIDSAAVTQGQVSLHSYKKVIQHLEGGIIQEILVKEGDTVKRGDALIKLNPTLAQSNRDLLLHQLRAATAQEIRLLAERDQQDKLIFDNPLFKDQHNPDIEEIITDENNFFQMRRKTLQSQIDILHSRIEQLHRQIEGIKAQQISTAEQVKLTQEELSSVEELFQSGNSTKPQLLELKRKTVELTGQAGALKAQLAQTEQTIGETQLQIINLKNSSLNDVNDLLQQTRVNINDLKEKLIASEDVLHRSVIRAPQDGIVTGLKFHTIGGVIPPGAEIMSIVPQNDKLIVETRLNPKDIDSVHPGLKAKVRLSAYKSRIVPMLLGTVTYVSADLFVDPNQGISYYLVKVEIPEDELKKLDVAVELYPGMPAEVLIVTGKRTLFGYMMDPVKQNFRRAFKEQ